MKNPFYDEEFIKSVCDFSEGEIYSLEPIVIIQKGKIIKRGYSLPYGFYGGFKEEVDIPILRKFSKDFFKFYVYDFENKIRNVDFLKYKEAYTYILEVPDSFEVFLKKVHKNRYKSIKKLYNKVKKYNITMNESLDYFDDFYKLYVKVYSKHHKTFKKNNILKLSKFLNLINVFYKTYIGGILILRLGDYALLWISGYERFNNFSTGEFLFCSAVQWAINNKIQILDFGLETTPGIAFIKQSFGTIRYKYSFWFK